MEDENYPRTGPYRAFKKAAELSGMSKSDRVETAKKFQTALQEGPEKIKERLTPQALESFFVQLAGVSNSNPGAMRQVGHVLYEFGFHAGGKKVREIPESNYKFVELACKFIEAVFYQGKIFHMTDDEAAPLAYVVNSITKIFGNALRASKIEAFNKERFDQLIVEVEQYRNNRLASHGATLPKAPKRLDFFREYTRDINLPHWGAEAAKPRIVYFIKSCLIAESMLRQNFDEQQINEEKNAALQFVESATQVARKESKITRTTDLSHEFKSPSASRNASSASRLHYSIDSLSSALWTVLYLRSKGPTK